MRLEAGKVYLRPPAMEDYEAWAKLRAASRRHTEPWEPTWAEDELTRAAYRRRVQRYDQDRHDGAGYAFFVFRAEDRILAGACNLNNVRRGVLQAADIGYWTGSPYVRRGYARLAIRRIVAFAFEDLGLHRIEAACRPENAASKTLLQSIGFQPEGLARGYLNIAGAWRDHEKFALLSTDRMA